jgi:hypothetical protein
MKKLAVIAAAAVSLMAVGFAVGAIPGPGGVINGCYKDANGDLRVIDPSSSKKELQACKKEETPLSWNQQGQQGATGATGATGPSGPQGDAWTPEYGIASVWVSRGGAAATPWASYSTTLGSPLGALPGNGGDTTGGVFRFSCSAAQAPCKLSIQADGPAGTEVYPRVLIYKQDFNAGGPAVYCEYGDGATNNTGPSGNYGFQPVGSALTFGVGGTLDCPGNTAPLPAGGTAAELELPIGRYDVWSTFTFQSASVASS